MDLSERIRIELANAKCRNESPYPVAFIPYAKLKKIWGGDRLVNFVNDKGLGLDPDQIAIAEQDLLQTISILLAIEWKGWFRFKAIFFPPDEELASRRRDKNIPGFKLSELRDSSFLDGDVHRINLFLQVRWEYCPLVLEEGPPMELDSQPGGWRLPFTQEPERCGSGGFGEVTKEVIAPGQYIQGSLRSDKEITVARKRFPTGGYRRELKHLELLRKNRQAHERIVQALVTIILDELHILSPLAAMNLETFLDHHRNRHLETKLLDVIGEMTELADALDLLHSGIRTDTHEHQALCHMDLKPANILVYTDGVSAWTGEWKITDFGISRTAKMRWSGSTNGTGGQLDPATNLKTEQKGTYSAPDCDVLPPFDIWSFGCILARVVAFGLDPTELKNLDDLRAQPEIDLPDERTDHFCRGKRLNSHVKAWIESLPDFSGRYNVEFTTKMRDLLLNMLDIDPGKRPSAKEIRNRLHDLSGPLGHAILMRAVRKGDVETVKTMLSVPSVLARKDKLSDEGRTPLMEAAYKGRREVVSVLLDKGAEWDKFAGNTHWNCLHYAVHNTDWGAELIQAFHGLDFNNAHPEGRTPLWLFCSYFRRFEGHPDRWKAKLDALVQHGADVNQEYKGETVLELAVKEQKLQLAERLFYRHGARLSREISTYGLRAELQEIVKNALPDTPRPLSQHRRRFLPSLR